MNNDNHKKINEFDQLQKTIASTRRRLYLRAFYESACSSFLFAFCTALGYVALGTVLEEIDASAGTVLLTTLAIGIVATLTSFFTTKIDPREAEKSVDRYYEFDDRFLTAGELLAQMKDREVNEFERLLLQDCETRASAAEPEKVVSVKPSNARSRFALLGCALFALIFSLWAPYSSQALTPPNQISLDVSRELHDNFLVPIKELADADPESEELRALSAKLQNLVVEFDANVDDPKKGTAIVAKMENEIKNAIAALGVDRVEKSLKELGTAFSTLNSTRALATALAEQDYERAANELEKLEFEKMSVRDRQALADKLKKVAEILRSRKDDQTAQLTEQLAEELQSGKCASCKNTACKIAGNLRKHLRAKEASKQLNCQLARLGLCKSNCAGACSTCTSNCDSSTQKEGSPQQQNQGSQQSGKKAGGDGKRPTGALGISSDPLSGNDSQLDTDKTLTRVSGKENAEGASTVEKSGASEGAASSVQREFDEEEREYVKRIEMELDADSVPLERRRVVRAYFENARNSSAADTQNE